MQPITLSEDQLKKLKEMCFEIYDLTHMVDIYFMRHWLEICLYGLVPKVAEAHGKQPHTTPTWSLHMIRQKLINELDKVNPIDLLYDIWKHPDKYAQDL
jgi:hypothetical protein